MERFGKFSRVMSPGLNLLIPLVEEIKYVQSLKEMTLEIPSQSAVTHDNVTLHLDGVLYLKVVDPYKVSLAHSAFVCWFDCLAPFAKQTLRTSGYVCPNMACS